MSIQYSSWFSAVGDNTGKLRETLEGFVRDNYIEFVKIMDDNLHYLAVRVYWCGYGPYPLLEIAEKFPDLTVHGGLVETGGDETGLHL
jgi:hypothetical protein